MKEEMSKVVNMLVPSVYPVTTGGDHRPPMMANEANDSWSPDMHAVLSLAPLPSQHMLRHYNVLRKLKTC